MSLTLLSIATSAHHSELRDTPITIALPIKPTAELVARREGQDVRGDIVFAELLWGRRR
jgi:hypothetical protein